MSLLACPECRTEVSREAAVCPHCGTQLSHTGHAAATIVQLLLLVLALALTLPLFKQEYFAWKDRADAAALTSEPAATAAAGKSKHHTAAKKSSRPKLECGSADVGRGVTLSWRDEFAQALSSQRGIPLEDARASVARMKLNLAEFETLDEDRAAGTLQCAAVVDVSEGDGFQASSSEVTYRAELSDRGRSVVVTLIYAPVPPL